MTTATKIEVGDWVRAMADESEVIGLVTQVYQRDGVDHLLVSGRGWGLHIPASEILEVRKP